MLFQSRGLLCTGTNCKALVETAGGQKGVTAPSPEPPGVGSRLCSPFSKTGSTISPDQPASCSEFVLMVLGLTTGSSIFQESASDTGGSGDGQLLPFGHRPSRPVPYISSQYKAILYFEITCLPFKTTSRKGGTLLRGASNDACFHKNVPNPI
jgi:hypothetical protein